MKHLNQDVLIGLSVEVAGRALEMTLALEQGQTERRVELLVDAFLKSARENIATLSAPLLSEVGEAGAV